LKISAIDLKDYYGLTDSVIISGAAINLGVDTITSFSLNYTSPSISSNEAYSITLLPFQSTTFQFTDQIAVSAGMNEEIKVSVSVVNGTLDNDQNNDTIKGIIHVVNEEIDQLPFVEFYSAATCTPCVEQDEFNYDLLLFEGASIQGGNLSAAFFHIDSSANEPGYLQKGLNRYQWYQLSEKPAYVINGAAKGDASNFKLSEIKNAISPVSLETDFTRSGDSITVNCQVVPQINFEDATKKLFILIAEREVTITNSGSSEVKYLTRYISDGISLDTMMLGDTLAYQIMDSVSVGNPVSPGSGDYFKGFGNLSVIAFVQDTLNQQILQSGVVNWPLSLEETRPTEQEIGLFPNPAQDYSVVSGITGPFEIQIFDTNGALVRSSVNQTKLVDTKNLKSGIYFLAIAQKQNQSGKFLKLVVSH
ncbi:MAG: T9SS type A sorting domain-containing protein, partial [Flavobacteriales bacterium]|nr:T9SS type A sorting domain-containing protein [Flavobacteriales bacterium]